MKIKTVLEHSDEVSGTWVLEDGTKCYWTEGRSSSVVCVKPDGSTLKAPVFAMDGLAKEEPEIAKCLIQASDEGADADEYLPMTMEEEQEHYFWYCFG